MVGVNGQCRGYGVSGGAVPGGRLHKLCADWDPDWHSFGDTGLLASTLYRYRVRAVDAAGNLSAYSSIVNATTQAGSDTTPPSVPSSVAASAVSSTQVDAVVVGVDGQRGGDGVSGGAVSGGGLHDVCAGGDAAGPRFSDTGLSAIDELSAIGCVRSMRQGT